MKLKNGICLFAVMVLICACAAKTGAPPISVPAEEGDALFTGAEELFGAGDYDGALALYTEYLRLYDKAPLAAAALMKIGYIHALNGDFDDARSAYRRIVADYPGSSFVQDALVEELSTYYQQNRFREVIQLAPETLQRLESRLHIFKTYALIGDAYMALGAPIDAMDFYARAQEFASDLEQEPIKGKLKEAIAQLDPADLAVLVEHPDETLPMDFLLYQMGLNYALAENYDEALIILGEFLDRYPASEERILVESLIDEIKKNAVFKRDTVGVLLPLSGSYMAFGQRALKGIELAMVQFSSQSNNPPINIIVKDTEGDPGKTIQAMQELSQDQVAAILGPIVNSEVAAREAQKMGIPIITFTQKDNIPEIGDKVFRNFITPKMQVQAIASFAVETLGVYRFAILYPDETYGITFMNLFWDELIQLGGVVVGVESYNPKSTDFTDAIKKLIGLYYDFPEDLKPVLAATGAGNDAALSSNAAEQAGQAADENPEDQEPQPIIDFDAIFIPDSPGKTGLIVPQLAYFDIKDVYLLGTNLWHSDALIKIADQYVQGAIMPDGYFGESDSPVVQKFASDFEETFQEKPDYIEAVVFDSAMMLFHAVSRPHIRYRTEVRDELLALDNFPGVTGLTRFDENGEVIKKLHLLRIKGKRFVELR
jgi:ABC-type branched-subunit amino acid transport system substrate-binding protein/TolA-binding protein